MGPMHHLCSDQPELPPRELPPNGSSAEWSRRRQIRTPVILVTTLLVSSGRHDR